MAVWLVVQRAYKRVVNLVYLAVWWVELKAALKAD
jgi:hypothetical protein